MQQTTKENVLTAGVLGYLELDQDRFEVLAIDSYMRLERFKTGDAVMADRQTTRIRLIGAIHLLEEGFDGDGAAELLVDALMIVAKYNPQKKRELRKFTTEEVELVGLALNLADELYGQSTVWECTLAYKFGEDKTITGSDETEYVLMTIH